MFCALLHIWLYKCLFDWGGESCQVTIQTVQRQEDQYLLGLVSSSLYQLTIVSLCILTLFVDTCNPYFKIQIFRVLSYSLSPLDWDHIHPAFVRRHTLQKIIYLYKMWQPNSSSSALQRHDTFYLFIYAMHLHMGDMSHHRFLQLTQIDYSNLL